MKKVGRTLECSSAPHTRHASGFSEVRGTKCYHTHSHERHRLVANCQFYRLVAAFQQCKFYKTCQFHQVATSLLKSGLLQLVICRLSNSLKQPVVCLWITNFDNQLNTSLLTTCNRLVVNKLSQTMQTHPDIDLLITSLLQDVNRLVAICALHNKQLFP